MLDGLKRLRKERIRMLSVGYSLARIDARRRKEGDVRLSADEGALVMLLVTAGPRRCPDEA